ncbi:MAG TPA: single-stranded-DNA-specific exonuclease RecJ [Flavobacterium sp.]|nr:single-stranded-DNA-specific exonuclease RecJ [Flavobacterium sp.]
MRWTINSNFSEESVAELTQHLSIDRVLARVLVQRGIDSYEKARLFFRPSLLDLHDPYLMKDMDKAIARIEKAIDNNENILIYGDYDVDGTTAVSLVYSFLNSFYPNVATYIPDRYDEGYGISFKGIDFAHDNDFSLIIALDCGIKANDKISYAQSKDIDFIIADHHLPGDEIPNAVAVLDPKRKDCEYPFKELCGCGIGFKIIQALADKRGESVEDLVPYLDLVATAIGADIVPIIGENRILASFGLEVINANPRNGIKALIENTKKKDFTITDVVFMIAPRINAAGRIHHGNYAVKLLTEFNWEEAQKFALEIESFNSERKELDEQITKQALEQIAKLGSENRFTTVVFSENWHKGVIGIVASRLIETHYKPTVVFTESQGKMTASARSVSGFDIHQALEQCSEFIEQFGGHKYAAGLTVAKENFESFRQKFEKVVKESITEKSLSPEISIDSEIDFSDINPKFVRILKQFEPFGPGNMTPVFISKGVTDTGYAKPIGKSDEHLKMFAKQKGSPPINIVGFGLGNKIDLVKNRQPFDLVYSIEENQWNGSVSLQLKARDIR